MRFTPSEPLSHAEAWEIIPWLVNGRIADKERQRLQSHSQHCSQCQAEIALQQQICTAMSAQSSVEYMPSSSLQRLWSRIDADASNAPLQASATVAQRSRPLVRWLAAAVVIEAVGLTFLAATMWSGNDASGPGLYRTVTTAAAPGSSEAVIRAVFSNDLTVSELQTLLQKAGLRIVTGPTDSGVYSLALQAQTTSIDRTAVASAVATLRAHSGVRFTEPIVDLAQ
jgi:anti-sigma factor RsiW